ncbi:hypothetical protein ACF05L_02230 [Streptomyces bobili]
MATGIPYGDSAHLDLGLDLDIGLDIGIDLDLGESEGTIVSVVTGR